MEHTKGPWMMSHQDPWASKAIIFDESMPEGRKARLMKKIAEVEITNVNIIDTEGLANAHLIAAAPDLLEAAEKAARGAHHPACPIATGKGQTTVTHDDCTCHVGIARTAIEKAKPIC